LKVEKERKNRETCQYHPFSMKIRKMSR